MRKKMVGIAAIAMTAVLTACAGEGNVEETIAEASTVASTSETVEEKAEESASVASTEAKETKQEEKENQDSAEAGTTVTEEPAVEVYHNPDLDVKYSDDGTVTLCYQDQEIDITNNFVNTEINDEFGGYDCRVYLLDKDGNPVKVTVKYKFGCVALDDFVINDWKEEYHNYTGEDSSAMMEYQPKDASGSYLNDSYLENCSSGIFHSDTEGQMLITPAEIGVNELGTNPVMIVDDNEPDITHEMEDNASIYLFGPVQYAYGARVTKDAFMQLIQDSSIDCNYHLNDAGKIDVVLGIYYS